MQVQVNGEGRELPDGATVAGLVAELGLRPEVVAVERNLELVPREAHARTVLRDGDRVEIVTLVGGG